MSKLLKQSAEGRRCKYPSCDRLLSIYNHHSYCRIHQKEVQSSEKVKPYRHFGK